MRSRLAAVLGAITVACATSPAGAQGAVGLPVVSMTGATMRWWTGDDSHMTIVLRVMDATRVSARMTGYVFGSEPFPGLHMYRRTQRFKLFHVGAARWTATRRNEGSIGVAMSDRSTVAVRACNASGCVDTVLYFHMAGE